ncbi:50S ribosomal protein L4 [Flavobacteriales bacterium]|nr:50S ribosomal protein L4 [Flavobacteriales bacterium]
MEVAVYDKSGKKTSKKAKLNDTVFGIEPNDHLIYLDVRSYRASNRQGTHKSKERAEIAGSTKKIKKQKGTGTARAGSIKSPVFRGGGRVFGPQPRDYDFKLNKKVKQLARKSALTYKAKESAICVIEDFSFDGPQTKAMVALLSNMALEGRKTMVVLNEKDNNVYLSSRNLQDVKVVTVSELNTYNIVDANNVVITSGAVKQIEDILS